MIPDKGGTVEALGHGVHRLPVGSNAYLVDGDEGVVLVDTGIPGRLPRIRDGLRGIGRDLEDLRAVLITHAHPDHVGSAADVINAGGGPVCMSPVDAAVARGAAPLQPPPMMDLVGPLKGLFALAPTPDPVLVEHEVSERDGSGLPQDWQVVQTPGHTDGHLSFVLDRAGGLLFAGDTAMASRRGRVVRGFFNARSRAVDASIARLAELDFAAAYFGHGRPLTSHAAAAFRRYAESRST